LILLNGDLMSLILRTRTSLKKNYFNFKLGAQWEKMRLGQGVGALKMGCILEL
jgi:hypothetical protein